MKLAKDLESKERSTSFLVYEIIIDLDVLVHNSGNTWGASFEDYVQILLVGISDMDSLIRLGFGF